MIIYFSIPAKSGRIIRTTEEYWDKIIGIKHPVMTGKEKEVKKTLKNPDVIRQSEADTKVFLYYKKIGRRYICVVVRHENGSGFIITSFPVDILKKGKVIYEKASRVS